MLPWRSVSLGEVYQVLTSTQLKQATHQLRQIEDQASNRNFKSTHFDFVTFGGVFSRRGMNFLDHYSGLMVIDLDDLAHVQDVRQQLLYDPLIETRLLFTSPNGNGLKWVIGVQSQDHSGHGQFFDAVRNYLKQTYRIDADKSGRDLARSCFLCYDPDAFLHPRHGKMNRWTDPGIFLVKRKRFCPEQWTEKPVHRQPSPEYKRPSASRVQLEVEVVIRRIEAFGVDLTWQYDDWVRLGFALASEFGEGGRSYFHRISRFYGGYVPDGCDRQYDACLKRNGSGITIRSFFAMARSAGVNIRY